jgi:hypothetical protein
VTGRLPRMIAGNKTVARSGWPGLRSLVWAPDGKLLTLTSAGCLGVISKGDVVDFNGSYVE